MARPKRIVCYAINGSGLGHVTRLLGVARWMRRIVTWLDGKPPEIFFVSSSEAPQLTFDEGFPTFKLPSKTVARSAGMDMLEYRRLAKHFIWNTLGVFKPDLLVIDTFPSGSFDELFQVLDGPFRKGLILREVKPEYAARPTFRAALKLYDTILVPGDGEAVARMQLPAGLPVVPVGRLTRLDRAELLDRAPARDELGVARDERLVYLSTGGGGDVTSAEVLQATAQRLVSELDCRVWIGAGPLYRGPRVYGDRILWSAEPGIARLFRACDAAISAAGYNTFHELMLAQVPAVFVAQDKIADDQHARVQRAVEAGAARLAGNADEAVAAVQDILATSMAGQAMAQAAAGVFDHNHADRAARQLLASLYPTESLDRATTVLTQTFVHAIERRGADPAVTYGRLLPALLPSDAAGPPGAHSALESIRGQLSASAQTEVEAALEALRDGGVVGAVHGGLDALLAAGVAAGVGLDDVAGLVEVGLRKHPPNQEPAVDRGAWMTRVLTTLTALLGESAEVTTLYRYWPRIADAPMEQSVALFRRYVAAGKSADMGPWDLQRQLRGFKSALKKVTVSDVEGLLGTVGA